ncbi:uncharacterized protein LOC114406474 [Glycine soja]|uniref:uncharacterized protein LOC114406474 n=1 Tax=Glycine soja TaxID=3848 RepID=UPI001038B662|nr:uncharacterized protein LOC114406474 [Glycine soja]
MRRTKKVKLAATEFSNYALEWWNKLQKERARNEEPIVDTWAEMKRIMRKRIPDPKRVKLASRAYECVFIGYAINSKSGGTSSSHLPAISSENLAQPEPDIEPRRGKRARIAKDYEPDYMAYTLKEDPSNLQEALSSLDADLWFSSRPSMEHWHAIERVMRYLKRTINLGLHYKRFLGVLEGYSDADWNTLSDDSKATSGYIFSIAGEAVSWKSKKQTILAQSTMESEMIALATASEEAKYLGYRSTFDRLTYVNAEVEAASYEILGKNF